MLELLRALPRRFRAALLLAVPAAGGLVAGGLLLFLPARTAVLALVGLVATGLLVLVLLPAAYALLGWIPSARPRWPEPGPAGAGESPAEPSGGPAAPTGSGRGSLALFLEQDASREDDTELRIGLVLAGGGAKGVYQAGALAALREFLEREGALPYVRSLAATSIGTWNAMFWRCEPKGPVLPGF